MTVSFAPQSAGSFSTTLTASGQNFSTASQLFGTGVASRGTSASAAPVERSYPTSVARREGNLVVGRD